MRPEAQRNPQAAMADSSHSHRYGAGSGGSSTDQATVPMYNFPGYISSDLPHSVSHTTSSTDFLTVAPNFVHRETSVLRPSAHRWNDDASVGLHSVVNGVTTGPNIKGCPSIGDSDMLRQQGDTTLGIVSGNAIVDRRIYARTTNGTPVLAGNSNIIFVDGLPTDCTRREVGHLFRPFIGFKDVKVVHKEPRRSRDKAMVLCFVEFLDSKCALTALEALQGYKFDDRKPDSNVLKISFAHFPFRLPSDHDTQRPSVSH